MKKTFSIKGMHCNSCADSIERELKDKVNSISVSYAHEKAEIDFDESKITEKEIEAIIKKKGYDCYCNINLKSKPESEYNNNKSALIFLGVFVLIIVLLLVYKTFGLNISSIQIPEISQNISLILLFIIGLLTGFHCVSMCGGFVISYTAKNALKGHTGFSQHAAYGTAKVISYTIMGALFGLIGGLFSFSIGLRAGVAIFAGIFMILYSLSMFGLKFFRKFQFNPKFLTKYAVMASTKAEGPYLSPIVTGLLNGLFIACGPLQAMYLYAAGTGSLASGALSLFVFGLGTLPVMLAFGSLATVISHTTTKKILKFSAIIVLILGLIMLNRGLSLAGSNFSFDSIKSTIIGTSSATIAASSSSNAKIINGAQEINMNVDASGYSPNSFVIKQGVPVKWNVNVITLTSCNSELVMREYNIDKKLQKGLNVIEFTPTKTGTISFTCGMGMLHGSFIVTADGTATQQQVQAATPSKGSTCSMSSGGSCGCGMM